METRESDFEVAGRIAHVEPLLGLDKKLRPGHAALLVIDMQNDFIASAGLVGRSGRDVSAAQKLAEELPAFIAAARRAGVLVVFIRNVYSTERNFYLSDCWLEQAARKQSGGYTRFRYVPKAPGKEITWFQAIREQLVALTARHAVQANVRIVAKSLAPPALRKCRHPGFARRKGKAPPKRGKGPLRSSR
jgi:Isochorismatase family